jgi:hypothetical protein
MCFLIIFKEKAISFKETAIRKTDSNFIYFLSINVLCNNRIWISLWALSFAISKDNCLEANAF